MSQGDSFPSQSSQQQENQAFRCKSKRKGLMLLPSRNQVLHLHFPTSLFEAFRIFVSIQNEAFTKNHHHINHFPCSFLPPSSTPQLPPLPRHFWSQLRMCCKSILDIPLLVLSPGLLFSHLEDMKVEKHLGFGLFFFLHFVFNGAHRPYMRSAPKVMPPVSLWGLLQKWVCWDQIVYVCTVKDELHG